MATTLQTVQVRSTYPCCEGQARFARIPGVPRQRYARRCPQCGQAWDVEARTGLERPGLRVDVLEWGPVVPETPETPERGETES